MAFGPPASDSDARGSGTVTLAELAPGSRAVLWQIVDPQSRAVLRSLGLVQGAPLRLCRVGDPCIVQVRSTRIGLSSSVAHSVHVIPTAGDQP